MGRIAQAIPKKGVVAICRQRLQDYICICRNRWTFWALMLKPLAHQYEPLYLRKPLWSASPSPLGNDEWSHVCESWKNNWIYCLDSYLLLISLLQQLNKRYANKHWLICFSTDLILYQGKGNLQHLNSKGRRHMMIPIFALACHSPWFLREIFLLQPHCLCLLLFLYLMF